jgi:GPH family glycoside/pentoside/hexuronide:cation symporter
MGHRPPPGVSLPGYAVFAAMLSAAGLPIYIHAPAYYASTYGVGPDGAGGGALRAAPDRRGAGPAAGLAVGAAAGAARGSPWVGVVLLARLDAGPFRRHAAGRAAPVVRADDDGAFLGLLVPDDLHVRRGRAGGAPAGRRCRAPETRGLARDRRASGRLRGGGGADGAGRDGRALCVVRGGLRGSCVLWRSCSCGASGAGCGRSRRRASGSILSDPVTRRLLLIALDERGARGGLLDAVPVLRRKRAGRAGLGGAASGPVLPRRRGLGAGLVAPRHAVRRTADATLAAMALAIASFSVVLTLGPGDTVGAFAIVCLVSGAALGADFAILPALFARRMEEVAPRRARPSASGPSCRRLRWRWRRRCCLPALDAAGLRRRGGARKRRGAALLT